ncbi:MAG: pyruvate kinase, partial [Saprospiraceae bacterium]|nr:pyruvate kinase [Saprospiraceae bacterium]
VRAHPVKVVHQMNRFIEEAEKNYRLGAESPQPSDLSRTFLSDAVCFNAAKTAQDINAKAIIGMTSSGYTAFKVSSYRPQVGIGIFIFSDRMHMLATLNLCWGVRCFYYDRFTTTDQTFDDVVGILKSADQIKTGDVLVHTGSMPIEKRHRTNMLKVNVVE